MQDTTSQGFSNKYSFIEDIISQMVCPKCKSPTLGLKGHHVHCSTCQAEWDRPDLNMLSMIDRHIFTAEKTRIQEFWGDMCQQWYTKYDENLTTEKLKADLEAMVDMFHDMKHLATTEMDLENLAGKKILEIGSGCGAHSALFKMHGAHITSVDITPERVESTKTKLDLIPEGKGAAMLADAENLPFRDGTFDIVYSNGVLHHSQDDQKCFEEAKRVLKPGGELVMMLYARYSALHLLNLLPKALLSGMFFRKPEAEWMGVLTEGKPKNNKTMNSYTRCYSKSQMLEICSGLKVISLRKNGFYLNHIPLVTKLGLRNSLLKSFGVKPHPGSLIVYGEEMSMDTTLESLFRELIGNNWNLKAIKES